MNRTKKLGILLGVLVCACVATFAVVKFEDKKEQIKNSDEVILSLPADTITAFSWDYDDASLSFVKEENWQYKDDSAFPVDQDKVAKFLGQFSEFGVAFIIEDVEDFAQYGLDEPECTITLSTSEKEYEITLGNFSEMDQQRYVSIGDGNVYLVNNDPVDTVTTDLGDLVKHDETPLFGDISEVIFEGSENYTVFYDADNSYSLCEDDYFFTQQNGETVPLDTDLVESYTGKISNLVLEDYVTYNATEEELSAFGLDNPQLTVTVNYTDIDENGDEKDYSYQLNVSRDPEEIMAAEAEETAEDDENDEETEETVTAYARVGDSQIVYKITADDYKNLMAASYNDLRHKDLFTADIKDVVQIDITLEGENYTLNAKEASEEEEIVFLYNEEETDITDFKDQLNDLEAAEFTDEVPTGKEEISAVFTLNDENSTQISIALYRYDGENCIATVDGETVCLISRSHVVDFIEAVNSIVLM